MDATAVPTRWPISSAEQPCATPPGTSSAFLPAAPETYRFNWIYGYLHLISLYYDFIRAGYKIKTIIETHSGLFMKKKISEAFQNIFFHLVHLPDFEELCILPFCYKIINKQLSTRYITGRNVSDSWVIVRTKTVQRTFKTIKLFQSKPYESIKLKCYTAIYWRRYHNVFAVWETRKDSDWKTF